MRIGLTYNLKSELPPSFSKDPEHVEEFDAAETIEAISCALESGGFEVVRLGFSDDLAIRLKEERVDFVFNIAEGLSGRNRESQVPAILEMLDIPYFGSDALALGMSLDKLVFKKICYQAGIPTPRHVRIDNLRDLKNIDKIGYPAIIKPAWEGSSKGVYNASCVNNYQAAEKICLVLFDKYPNQPLIAEEYIKGREITVGITGNSPAEVIGLMEIRFREKKPDFFYSLEVKRDWQNLVEYIVGPDIDNSLKEEIETVSLKAFREFDARDVCRMDFKISNDNKPYLLEINPLPGLSPEYSDLIIMIKKLGVKYDDFIISILQHALKRYNLKSVSLPNPTPSIK